MSAYAEYPNIEGLTIAKRTTSLKETCVEWLAQGNNPAELLARVDDVVDKEQYEMAQAITLAVKEFADNPQLALF
jgi:hypothetical protein